jgi:hypothetical protein
MIYNLIYEVRTTGFFKTYIAKSDKSLFDALCKLEEVTNLHDDQWLSLSVNEGLRFFAFRQRYSVARKTLRDVEIGFLKE